MNGRGRSGALKECGPAGFSPTFLTAGNSNKMGPGDPANTDTANATFKLTPTPRAFRDHCQGGQGFPDHQIYSSMHSLCAMMMTMAVLEHVSVDLAVCSTTGTDYSFTTAWKQVHASIANRSTSTVSYALSVLLPENRTAGS